MSNTSAYPYTFDALSRIGNDNVAVDQRNIQNMNNTNYTLENFYPACPMNTAIDFALNQPNVFYKGSHEGGVKGCEIETNNELKYTHITRPACKLSLAPRPYLTVPYLGRGLADPELECQLMQGENALNKKTVNNTMELSFAEHKNYPLLDSLQSTVTNPSYLIEDDAFKGWVRGGMSAREYARNQDKKQ
tara:strand:- start:935 stop:1504 length:570 start_codon:yes stop_codon:yes gene_type:complete